MPDFKGLMQLASKVTFKGGIASKICKIMMCLIICFTIIAYALKDIKLTWCIVIILSSIFVYVIWRLFKFADSKNTDNQKIIELTKLKPLIRKTRNKGGKNNSIFNIMKSEEILEDKISKKKSDNILFNKSFNNIYDKNEIIVGNKNDLGNKEQLKKIKLEKLGKLFKNLEKENSIINTIKEQFLDWTNKNILDIKQDKNINKKEYNLRTFDINNNNFTKLDKRNNLEDKYDQIINNFRCNIISFAFRSKNKKI